MIVLDVPGIPLRRVDGSILYALVDPEDFVALNEHRWSYSNGYALRFDYAHYKVRMHRWLMGLANGDEAVVDHMNGDTLDNRRANLRIASRAQNNQNQHRVRGRSRFRGVHHSGKAHPKAWVAQAHLNGRKVCLGVYHTEIEAARVAAAFRKEHMPFSQEREIA